MLVEEEINCILFVHTCIIWPTVKGKRVLVERNVTMGRISDMIRKKYSAPQRGIERQSLTIRVSVISARPPMTVVAVTVMVRTLIRSFCKTIGW